MDFTEVGFFRIASVSSIAPRRGWKNASFSTGSGSRSVVLGYVAGRERTAAGSVQTPSAATARISLERLLRTGCRRKPRAEGDDWFFFDPGQDKDTNASDEIFAGDLEWTGA